MTPETPHSLIDPLPARFRPRSWAFLLALICLSSLPAPAQGPDPAEEILDPVKQKAIWDAEHITFEIEHRFGAPFKDVLRKRDAAKLATWFHKAFEGAVVPSTVKVVTRKKGIVRETARETGTNTAEKATSKRVITAMLDMTQPITTVKSIKLRVLKIELDKSEWKTRMLFTASGKGKGGRMVAVNSLQDVSFRIKDDGEFVTGPCIASWKILSEQTVASERALMEEVTKSSGLTKAPIADNWNIPVGKMRPQFPSQMAVEDFDRDGYLDIAIATTEGPTALFRSVEGKKFVIANMTHRVKTMATHRMRDLATWIDYNNDGYPDLILGNRVYQNQAGASFEEVTNKVGLAFPNRPMGTAVADYDGDGFTDLYILYQFAGGAPKSDKPLPWVGDDISGAPNALWRNRGDGTFEDVTKKSGAGGGLRNSFAAVWVYADDDAYPDLYVANDFGKNNLLRNRGDGTFEDVSNESGVADFATSMGVAAGDIDNDGTPEMYVANMYSKMGRRIIAHVGEDDYSSGIFEQIKGACAGNRLYKRKTKGDYSEWSESWGINDIGWAYAPAMTDLDNDGLLDLYATTGFMSFTRGKPDG